MPPLKNKFPHISFDEGRRGNLELYAFVRPLIFQKTLPELAPSMVVKPYGLPRDQRAGLSLALDEVIRLAGIIANGPELVKRRVVRGWDA